MAIRCIVSIIVSVHFIFFKSRKREGAIGSCNILLRIRYMFMAIQIMSWITWIIIKRLNILIKPWTCSRFLFNRFYDFWFWFLLLFSTPMTFLWSRSNIYNGNEWKSKCQLNLRQSVLIMQYLLRIILVYLSKLRSSSIFGRRFFVWWGGSVGSSFFRSTCGGGPIFSIPRVGIRSITTETYLNASCD